MHDLGRDDDGAVIQCERLQPMTDLFLLLVDILQVQNKTWKPAQSTVDGFESAFALDVNVVLRYSRW